MGDPVTMALTGAAIGGGTSLLRGKGLGSALQNAAISGALGGATGAAGQAMGIGGSGIAGAGIKAGTGAIPATGIDLVKAAAPSATDGAIDFNLASGATGGPGINDLSQYATGTGTNLMADPSGLDKLKALASQYGTVDNLTGAAKLYAAMPQNKQGVPPQSNASVIKASQLAEAPLAGLLNASNNMTDYKKPHFTLLG